MIALMGIFRRSSPCMQHRPMGTQHCRGPNSHLEQFVRPIGCPDAQLLQELHHEAAEPLEGAGQAHLRVYLYEGFTIGGHIQCLQPGKKVVAAVKPIGSRRKGNGCW